MYNRANFRGLHVDQKGKAQLELWFSVRVGLTKKICLTKYPCPPPPNSTPTPSQRVLWESSSGRGAGKQNQQSLKGSWDNSAMHSQKALSAVPQLPQENKAM